MATVQLRSKLHPGQWQVANEAARYNVLACGRRWGKTELGKHAAIQVAAGQHRPVGWFSPTYRMLSEVWRNLVHTLQPVTLRSLVSEHRLELAGGGAIEMWSLDAADTVRGRRYARVILDEAAMVGGLDDAWQNAIRPTLTDYRGDAWFLSTPAGRNYFWQLWTAGQDETQTEWRSWQMPTSSNPFINADEIEAARQQLPERVFAQEYLAQFIDDTGAIFRGVMQAQTATAQTERIDGHSYVMGLDWGKLNDFTVCSVLDITTHEQCYLDRFNQISYEVQLGRVRDAVQRFKPAAILAESNSIGEPLLDRLRHDGLIVHSFATTSHSKAAIIEALALAIEQGRWRLLPDPVQSGELLAYEAERLPSGTMRYGAPSGSHDDTVMALALAVEAAGNERPAAHKGVNPFAIITSPDGPKMEMVRTPDGLRFRKSKAKINRLGSFG